MSIKTAEVLICGAGIAGVSTAYHLAVRKGVKNVVLADEHAPLTLTSDKSTEAYRNFWPGMDGAMVQMMNRSIDLLEDLAGESGNVFGMNRRGYLFATADHDLADQWEIAGNQAASFGAGALRLHKSRSHAVYHPLHPSEFLSQPSGADLITDPALIQSTFPYLTDETVAVLHIRRAGWLSAQQLGMYMLRRAQESGVQLIQARVESIQIEGEKIRSVGFSNGENVSTPVFINAAGPFLKHIGALMGVDLPVVNELHLKSSIADYLMIIPREAPMVIWGDHQHLNWQKEERAWLENDPDSDWLLGQFPAGVHGRPEGEGSSQIVLLLWEYDTPVIEPPQFPVPKDPLYPEIVLRGMTTMLPGLKAYLGRLPKPYLDGGYYTKTVENRPFSCPLPVEGAYVIGALSGFGIMSSPGLGELLANLITKSALPDYAPAFHLDRYEKPDYRKKLRELGETWEL